MLINLRHYTIKQLHKNMCEHIGMFLELTDAATTASIRPGVA